MALSHALSEVDHQSGGCSQSSSDSHEMESQSHACVSLSVVRRGKVQSYQDKQPDDRKHYVSSPTAYSLLIKLAFRDIKSLSTNWRGFTKESTPLKVLET